MLSSQVTFGYMRRLQLQGFRNGCWRRLSGTERALFKVGLWYARVRGGIVSTHVVGLLHGVFERLRTFMGLRVYHAGELRVKELRTLFEGRNVLGWCPRFEAWLREDRYILYLGAVWTNSSEAFRSPL